jgi:hypothetical protein
MAQNILKQPILGIAENYNRWIVKRPRKKGFQNAAAQN